MIVLAAPFSGRKLLKETDISKISDKENIIFSL